VRSRILLPMLLLVLAREARADPIDDDIAALTPPCLGPDSEVVGYRKCTPYGAWSLEVDERALFVSYGMTWRHFGDVTIPSAAARSTSTSSSTQSIDALVFVERAGVSLSHGAFAAFEIEMGNFAAGSEADSHDIIVGGLGQVGLRAHLAPLTLGGELGLGYRGYSEPDSYELVGELVVEARGRAEVWLSPWFTIGAVAGSSLRRHGDWMAGISLGFHTQAYAGER